mgnify:CR=1 FL=1
MFVNRKYEISFIKKVIRKPGFQLIPVWGRRRIGKTSLLTYTMGGDAFYFLATESTSIVNLNRFREELSEYLDDEIVKDLEPDWEVLFKYLSKKDLVIIIDEFPYLVSADESIPSQFQRIVDLFLVDSSMKLFLCGSSVRMMESFVLDYKAPLYGRRTGQIKLKQLGFRDLKEFFPEYSIEDLVVVYGICGGIPMYLLQFDPSLSVMKNIENVFLDPFSIMYEEERFLLKQEFKNITMYRSILFQLTSGRTKIGEVRESLQLRKSDITPYLTNLRAVDFVDRIVPVTDDPSRSRAGIYKISDNFLRFYYFFIYPRMGLIESRNIKGIVEFIEKNMDPFLGRPFEDIAKEIFDIWCQRNDKQYEKVGTWWHGEEEIDLVGLNSTKNEGICIEVKWSGKVRDVNDIKKLIEKKSNLRWGNEETRWSYIYISKGGFTRSCIEWMDDEKILHWDLNDIERILWD